jgi:hypothetical protein
MPISIALQKLLSDEIGAYPMQMISADNPAKSPVGGAT